MNTNRAGADGQQTLAGLMDAGLQVARVGECDVGDLAQRGACRTLTAAHYTFRRMKGPEAVMELLTLVSVYCRLKHSAVCTQVEY